MGVIPPVLEQTTTGFKCKDSGYKQSHTPKRMKIYLGLDLHKMQNMFNPLLIQIWFINLMAACWSHRCGAEVWLVDLFSLSFSRFKCTNACKHLTQTQTAATILRVDVETRSSLLYPATQPVCHRVTSNQIRDHSFSANSAQVQTQALYEKSKYNFALVERAVSTTVVVFELMLQKQLVPQPVGVLKVQ